MTEILETIRRRVESTATGCCCPGAAFSFCVPREPDGAVGTHELAAIRIPAVPEVERVARSS